MATIGKCKQIAADVKVHFLNTPVEVIYDRLLKRNATLPKYNFLITPERLDMFSEMFENPACDEGAELIVVDGHWGENIDGNEPGSERPYSDGKCN